MKPTKAKIADVARTAGVSAATVARVIHKSGYVKDKTRLAVEEAVRATGYRPNMMARGLRTSRSFTLGLVVSETRLSAFHMDAANVVQLEALKLGYTVLTLNNHADIAMEQAGVRRFLDHHVDAVIFCSAMDPGSVRLIHDQGIPTVQIERQTSLVGGLVAPDPKSGTKEAIDHLYDLGHRRFAYIGGKVDGLRVESLAFNAVEPARERAFLESVASHGLPMPPQYVKSGPYYRPGKMVRQPGYDLMQALLDLDPRPTAVLCASDVFAASALQAINHAHLRVPQDLSVIGYDDSMAEILTPALSSIAQPIEELGRLAVAMAVAAIDDADALTDTVVVPTRLVLRESTGPVPPDQTA